MRTRTRTLVMSLAVATGSAFGTVLAAEPADKEVVTTDASGSEATPEGPARDEPVRTTLVERVEVSATVAREREDPASFSDLDREEIEQRHRGQDLGMLLGDTPNAYAYSDAGNGVGYSYLRLRGFDQTRIAVNINGVPLNTPESRQVFYIDLADFAESLERVQIQRGPATALLGSPAVAGVVNLETGNLPTSRSGRLTVGTGSFGTHRLSFRYGGPLAGGRWAWMARLAHARSDGYREPSGTRHTLGHVAFQKFDPVSIWRIHIFGGPENTQLAYFGVPREYLRGEVTGDADRDRRTNFLKPGETDTFVQPQIQIHNDRRLRDGLFVRNTWYAIYGRGYFRQFADLYRYDPRGYLPPDEEFPDALFVETWRKRWIENRQVGWMPGVSWNHRNGTLTAGAEILVHTGHHRGTVTEGLRCAGPSPGGDPGDPCGITEPLEGDPLLYDYRNRKSSFALYARETYRPRSDVAVHMEIQGTHHRFAMRDDRIRGLSFDASYTFVTPRVGVNWNVSDRWNLYAQAATGRSEPVFTNVWNPQDTAIDPSRSLFRSFDPAVGRLRDPEARPERVRSIEAGVGYRNGTNRFKANVYRMAFRDEFVFAGGLDEDGVPLTENAGRTLHAGLEVEGGMTLPGDVDLSGYAAVSRDELIAHRLVSRLDDGSDLLIDYSGNRVALFPDHLVRLRLARTFGAAHVEVGARRVGTIYTDNSQDERKNPERRAGSSGIPYVPKKVAPRTVTDLRVTLDIGRLTGRTDGGLSLSLWVENVLDRRYETMGYSYPIDASFDAFYTEFFPAASRNAFVALTYGF